VREDAALLVKSASFKELPMRHAVPWVMLPSAENLLLRKAAVLRPLPVFHARELIAVGTVLPDAHVT